MIGPRLAELSSSTGRMSACVVQAIGESAVITAERSTQEVFEDHLWQCLEGSVEEDLARNYADDVVILSGGRVHRGHEGLRRLAARLRDELPDARFYYKSKVVEGDVAFLEWTAETPRSRVEDGADSFVIRNGRIVAQTIHYTVVPRSSSPPGA